jgi:adenosine deaminase
VSTDFAADNVVYLELRTTPRAEASTGMTQRSYVQCILEAIQEYQQHHSPSQPSIMVKLLLSINRAHTAYVSMHEVSPRLLVHLTALSDVIRDVAMAIVQLAIEFKEHGVIGVDYSGNPYVGSFQTHLQALKHAQQHGLKITLHIAEIDNDAETLVCCRSDCMIHAHC